MSMVPGSFGSALLLLNNGLIVQMNTLPNSCRGLGVDVNAVSLVTCLVQSQGGIVAPVCCRFLRG
jgi:hypothetical protein